MKLPMQKLQHQEPHCRTYGKPWEMSADRQHGYPRQSIKLQVASPPIHSKCQANCTLCKYPIHWKQHKRTLHCNHFIRPKHMGYRDWLLKMFTGPLNLLFNGATIKLNLHDVCLLLTFLQQLHLIQATLDFQIFILSITCFIYTVSN